MSSMDIPLPHGTYLAAEMARATLFAAIVSLLLMLVGAIAAGLVLTIAAWSTLFALAVLGVIPFCSIGLLVGALARASAAAAPLWPSWQLAQAVQAVAGAGLTAGIGWPVLALMVTSGACSAAAWRALSTPR